MSENFLSCNKEKILELKKDKKKKIMDVNNILKISKFCVMRLTENQKYQ